MIVVANHLSCCRSWDYETDRLEAVFVEINLKHGKMFWACIYCPPNSRRAFNEFLNQSLARVSVKSYSSVCVVTDFNAHIDWTDTIAPLTSSDDQLLHGNNRVPTSMQTCHLHLSSWEFILPGLGICHRPGLHPRVQSATPSRKFRP